MRLVSKHMILIKTLAVGWLATATVLHADTTLDWYLRSSGSTKTLNGVCFGNDKYIAVGYDGTLLQSPNGLNWSAVTPFTTGYLRGVAYGNNAFVCAGGSIWRSADGVTWTEPATPMPSRPRPWTLITQRPA